MYLNFFTDMFGEKTVFFIEYRKSPVQRATYEYLRGKLLDVVPEYNKEAEDHLSKAVSSI